MKKRLWFCLTCSHCGLVPDSQGGIDEGVDVGQSILQEHASLNNFQCSPDNIEFAESVKDLAALKKDLRTQLWFCVVCNRRGEVNHESGDDVYTVINLLRDDHARKSPSCPHSNIQAVNKSAISEQALAEIMRMQV